MSFSVTTRTLPPPGVFGVQRLSTSCMRTHCTTVPAQSEDQQPGADLTRTRLGEWEGSRSLALPPQTFVRIFAACSLGAACACGPAQRFVASRQAASRWPPSLTGQRGA